MKKENLRKLALCVVVLSAVVATGTPALAPVFGGASIVEAAESKTETTLKSIVNLESVALKGDFVQGDADFLLGEKIEVATVGSLKSLFKNGTSTNIMSALADALVTGEKETYVVRNENGDAIKEDGKTTNKTATYEKGKSTVAVAKEFLRDKASIKSVTLKLDLGSDGMTKLEDLNKLAAGTAIRFGIDVTTFDGKDNFRILPTITVKEPTITGADATVKVGDTYTFGLTMTDFDGKKLIAKNDQTVTDGDYKGYQYVYRSTETNFLTSNAVGYAKFTPITDVKDGKFNKEGKFVEKLEFVRFDNTGKAAKTLTYSKERTVTVEKEKEEPTPSKVTAVPLYRSYNKNNGEHMYTESKGEHNYLVSLGWVNENAAWNAASEGDIIYRLYNPNSGEHFFTMREAEYNRVASNGWRKEGKAFYSSKEADRVPVYRVFNPNTTKAGSHHYTVNKAEVNWLVSLGWEDEGIAFYGVK